MLTLSHSPIIKVGKRMHEYSVTENILNLALEKAKGAKANKITRINLVLGELSGVVGECVQQYYKVLCRDTIASGAAAAMMSPRTFESGMGIFR